MTTSEKSPAHPGRYVRKSIIPASMSVTDAAKLLGVGRPALSNFLNGQSALSPEMAVRLEKAFGADRERLLEMQTAYERQELRKGEKEIAVRRFVPEFLTIKARHIEDWANSQIEARTHLAVLLRKLVHSTGDTLRRVDFPGYDNAERKGSDGFVEAGAATPWVPEGTSYWEFGTGQHPARKAESDYNARLETVEADERRVSTFIFVTPRAWPGKNDWEQQKNTIGDWKAVRVFDASDLEQWLEQSVPAQMWFAEQVGLPTEGYETLEQAWRRWANVCEPPLTTELFASSIAASRTRLRSWLDNNRTEPLVVTADSRDEALAFLACLFDIEEFQRFKDRAAIFTSPPPLKKLLTSKVPFIPVIDSEDTERELAADLGGIDYIVFRPQKAVEIEADIRLGILDYEAFEQALTSMEIERTEIERLSRESGRSPTILRRRLSKNAAIRAPKWADDTIAKALVPIVLIGAWHTETEADREILSYVADRQYGEVEDEVARLLGHDDSPVWSVGRHRGVVSKIDALFAVARLIVTAELDHFFEAAEYVLSETDPALELPAKQRWAAALHGKKRDHSGTLRDGIYETLVILSIHGNNLFQSRLGIDVEGRVAGLIRSLLTPLTLEKLLSQDLPRYAEAAPETFLEIIEEDLRRGDPVVLGLLEPVDSGSLFSSPLRTGLLWALECLAWKPENLPRVSLILARLSRQTFDDNWANKPIGSLRAIFRSWMPQTAASVQVRVKALETLTRRFSDIGWQLCIDQIKPGSRTGTHNYMPRWRNDASGAGHVVTHKECYEFNRKALDILIAWPSHNENTLGDLVETLQGIPEEDQTTVWALIDRWSQDAREAAMATLRERIRRFAFTRRSRRSGLGEVTLNRAREVYDSLRPRDPVIRHEWLFAAQWVEFSADETEEDELNLQQREERIGKLRREAMTEIWNERAFDGVRALLVNSSAADVIGRYLVSCVTGFELQVDLIESCLSIQGDLRSKAEGCLQGFLLAMEVSSRAEVLQAVAEGLPDEERRRLFTCAPFEASTWRLLDGYGEDIRTGYWKKVFPSWGRHTPAELTELIDRLLEVERPRAAFHAVQMDLEDIETSRLKRLLREVATVNAELAGHFMLDRYYISMALNVLDGRSGVTRDEMAQLEFHFLDALDHSDHGIPNLEHQIAESPALFVQAVALVYKRKDGGEDPPEWSIDDPEQREAVGLAAYRLLGRMKKIPGTDVDGSINATELAAWVNEVRRLSSEHARIDVGDSCLGQLLARAPEGKNGVWPCEAVCEVMEEVASPKISQGFVIGVHNARGVQWRGEGGDEERELAAKYRTCAEEHRFDYPFVGSVLEKIARSYDREAEWHDSEARVRRRLGD